MPHLPASDARCGNPATATSSIDHVFESRGIISSRVDMALCPVEARGPEIAEKSALYADRFRVPAKPHLPVGRYLRKRRPARWVSPGVAIQPVYKADFSAISGPRASTGSRFRVETCPCGPAPPSRRAEARGARFAQSRRSAGKRGDGVPSAAFDGSTVVQDEIRGDVVALVGDLATAIAAGNEERG